MIDFNTFHCILGQNIRSIRLSRGYTQQELARISGKSVSQNSRLERGKGDTTPEMLFALRFALECTFEELLKGTE